MGGLGKTTLAKKLYNHATIKSHFASLAWVSISQKWETQYILQKILLQLTPQDTKREEELLKMTIDQLQTEILDVYQNKKCLVVLDDIWSNDSWKDLKASFSVKGDRVKSKLLLTTRNVEVAKHVDSEGFLHQPPLLTNEESWKLLYQKAFPKNDCIAPKYLKRMKELGREMVSHCGGLPLAVVVLGGILVTKPTLTEWERVHGDVERSIRTGKGLTAAHQKEMQLILVSSFDDLPWQLVSCFMYLSKFPEDAEIETEKLYQLWMAEGLLMVVDRREGETMTDVAECYLRELAYRSMVQLGYEDDDPSLGKINSCRLHDLMRDLSLKKAKEVNLFDAFDFRDGNNNIEFIESSNFSGNATRQLVIFFGDAKDMGSQKKVILPDKNRRKHLRSNLLFFNDVTEFRPRMLRSLVHDLRFLRVLAIEEYSASGRKTVKFSETIGILICLRYLSLRGSRLNINLACIASWKHLQTLDLRFRYNSLTNTCKHLQNMERLQHLYLPSTLTKKLELDQLSNLETLVNISPAVCDIRSLETLRNLRKLDCRVDEIEEVEYLVNEIIPNNNLLQYLSLYICDCGLDSDRGAALLKQILIIGGKSSCNTNIHNMRIYLGGPLGTLPIACDDNVRMSISTSSLTMIHLDGSKLKEDPMATLEKYPNLRELILSEAYTGKKMVCSSTGFPKLKALRLIRLSNLEEWILDQGGMPQLSYLCVTRCYNMEMLPAGLRYLTHLHHIDLPGITTKFLDRVRATDFLRIESLLTGRVSRSFIRATVSRDCHVSSSIS